MHKVTMKSGIRCQVSGIRYQVSGIKVSGFGWQGAGCGEMMVIRNPYLGPCLLFVGRFSWVIMNNNFVKSLKYREMQQ